MTEKTKPKQLQGTKKRTYVKVRTVRVCSFGSNLQLCLNNKFPTINQFYYKKILMRFDPSP